MFSNPGTKMCFLLGAMLVGAAFGSFLGERWWTGSSLFLTRPEGFGQTRASRLTAILTGLLGTILIFAAILTERWSGR